SAYRLHRRRDRAGGPGSGVTYIRRVTRRNSERGRWRRTTITQRNAGGTHTISAFRRRPSATAAATSSGRTLNGAAFRPAVILERTKPGLTTMTWTPVPARRSPSPWLNASRPAFDA